MIRGAPECVRCDSISLTKLSAERAKAREALSLLPGEKGWVMAILRFFTEFILRPFDRLRVTNGEGFRMTKLLLEDVKKISPSPLAQTWQKEFEHMILKLYRGFTIHACSLVPRSRAGLPLPSRERSF